MTGFPLQIEADVRRRLAGLGVSPDDVEERFVRGTGPGGQKIKIIRPIPTVSSDNGN
jgi:hypothetical protein